MKKLMMAAAIVCVAAGVQAAAFSWATADAVGAISDSTIATGLAAGQTYGADAMNDIDTAGWTVSYTLTLAYGSETDTLTGTLVTSGFDGTIGDFLSSDVVVGGRDINYTITYTTSITDGASKDWDLTSNVMSGTWHAEDMGDITFGYGAPTSWSTASVPEPTSGLLMLLGMAGLALRRRRA